MRHKKWFLPLLAMVMALMVLPVHAIQLPPELLGLLGEDAEPAELALVEDNFIVYDGVLGRTPYYVAILQNKSDSVATLNQGKLTLVDEAGNVLAEETIYGSYPSYVAPGGVTYVSLSYMSAGPEVVDQVASWKMEAQGRVSSWEPELVQLPSKVDIALGSQEDYFTKKQVMTVQLMTEVTNTTGELLFEIRNVVLIRDASGKLVAIDEQNSMEVGTPAGGSIVLRSHLPDGLAQALSEKDMTPATAESFVEHEIP